MVTQDDFKQSISSSLAPTNDKFSTTEYLERNYTSSTTEIYSLEKVVTDYDSLKTSKEEPKPDISVTSSKTFSTIPTNMKTSEAQKNTSVTSSSVGEQSTDNIETKQTFSPTTIKAEISKEHSKNQNTTNNTILSTSIASTVTTAAIIFENNKTPNENIITDPSPITSTTNTKGTNLINFFTTFLLISNIKYKFFKELLPSDLPIKIA
jgi:hypothetical protein